MGRLYYRHELLADLRSHVPSESLRACETNDAALALAVYRAGGSGSLERLEGDFALVICDTQRARLLGARDPMGGYPLFWTQCDDTLALSTSMRPLLDLLPSRVLNLDYVADFLMMPGQRNEGPNEACAYSGIHRVLPGTILSLHTSTGYVERRAYWNWLARLKDPGTDQVPDVAAQYADHLRAAVRERLHGRTLTHLSGGMDSTSVSLLARDLVGSGVGKAPLHTLSLVYDQLPGLARERPYIESVLQHEKALVAHRLPADDLLDFDGFVDAPLHDEPYAGLWRLAMDRATVRVAAEVGAVTMLTGIGADDLLDVHPFYLADLLRQGRLPMAWREAVTWARVHNCSPWEILQPFGLVPLAPTWLLSGIERTWWWRGRRRLNEQNDWSLPPWILPDFARHHALRSRAIANAQQTYGRCQHTGLSVTLSALAHTAGDVIRWSVAAPHGITMAHPFLDSRLLCLGLGIQARLRPKPGKMKPVLAEAMRGILPDAIRNRRRKGDFNEVYYLGLARNVPKLEAMVQQAPSEDLGIIDKDCLIRCLHEASMASANARQLQRLNFTLSLLKWLCMQDEWQRTPRPSADIIRMPQQGEFSNGKASNL
jgi:asparagine synthase (glutamine-hydrolysing)